MKELIVFLSVKKKGFVFDYLFLNDTENLKPIKAIRWLVGCGFLLGGYRKPQRGSACGTLSAFWWPRC